MPRRDQAVVRRLKTLVRSGGGVGHGVHYQPLLKLATRTLPRNSYGVLRWLPMLGRYGHFRSYNELLIAVFVLWLGVLDLREQYPVWPWRHRHPLFGRVDCPPDVGGYSPGLLAIAERLGIAHGQVVGSMVPYVANEDLMLTVPDEPFPRAVMLSCKPTNMFGAEGLTARDAERLTMVRVFAQDLTMPWHLISHADLPQTLIRQLDGLEQFAVAPSERLASLEHRFADAMERQIDRGVELDYCRRVLIARLKLAPPEFDWLLSNALWHRRVSIDLRQVRNMDCPPARTTFAFVPAARQRLFGGNAA